MRTPLLLRLNFFLYQVRPFLVFIGVCLFDRLEGFGFLPFSTSFLLVLLFSWTLHRPEHVSAFLLFLVGVFEDVIGGSPLGVTSFYFLCLYGLLILQGRFFQEISFERTWVIFMLFRGVAYGVEWLMAIVSLGDVVAPASFIHSGALEILFYPWLVRFFERIGRAL